MVPHSVNGIEGNATMIVMQSRLCQAPIKYMSLGVALAVLIVLAPAGFTADSSYVYDDAGRLRAVIDPASDTAVYAYDAVGNLTGITRQTSSTLSVLQFTPSSSPIGATVTIYGTAFSTTPASNIVKFNGTTATVLTASTTILTATVPSGATSGSISVTVGANTATSSASFTVGSGVPTLSSFSPAVGNYGATVTLTGTNYDTTPINNRVAFTAAMGAVATATSTSITVPVPSTAQTGPISVTTSQGKATSAQEFFVAPPGITPSDIQYTGRITVDGSTVTASFTTASKNGLLVFDGIAGQRLDLGFNNMTVPVVFVSVYRPDGVVMGSPVSIGSSGGGIELPVLPMTGTYTILLDPLSELHRQPHRYAVDGSHRHHYAGSCSRPILNYACWSKCSLYLYWNRGANRERGTHGRYDSQRHDVHSQARRHDSRGASLLQHRRRRAG
ncbi:MAG: IPT/TIG domain-containing protein [Nitrospira sp.]